MSVKFLNENKEFTKWLAKCLVAFHYPRVPYVREHRIKKVKVSKSIPRDKLFWKLRYRKWKLKTSLKEKRLKSQRDNERQKLKRRENEKNTNDCGFIAHL